MIVAVVDGGKSELRLRIAVGEKRHEGVGPGHRASTDPAVDRRATVDAVRAALAGARRLGEEDLARVPPADIAFVGLTGAPGDPGERRRLEDDLSRTLATVVHVLDDGILAHAGALGGPGTVASVGTGTNVTSITPEGVTGTHDAWGPMMGDRGSAHAVGLAGLRAAAAALDGAGPPTRIVEHLDDLVGGSPRSLGALQRFLRRTDITVRVSFFADVVLRLAEQGDAVATAIEDDAAADLAATLTAAAVPDCPISWSGRLLTAHDQYRAKLRAACPPATAARLQPPVGGGLDAGPALLRALDDPGSVYHRALLSWARETA